MTFPATPISKTELDNPGEDDPPDAQPILLALIAAFNQLIGYVSSYMQGVLALTTQAATQTELEIPAVASGSFTATSTGGGFSGTVTDTIKYLRHGNRVVLYKDTNDLFGTSDDNIFAFQGVPVAIQPSIERLAMCNVIDNGANKFAIFRIASSGFAFATEAGGFTGFTPSGTKGLQRGWTVAYSL